MIPIVDKGEEDFSELNSARNKVRDLKEQFITGKDKGESRELFEWVKATELKEFNHPICIRYDGGGAWWYGTVCSIKELKEDHVSEHTPIEEIYFAKPIPQSSLKEDWTEELADISRSLYNALPVGEVSAFDLIKVIKAHLTDLDNLMTKYSYESSLTPKSISGVFVKYSERKPSVNGEYLCRFLTHLPVGLRGAEYLQYDKEEGGFMVEHNDYAKLEWFDELMLTPKSIRDSDGWISIEDGLPEAGQMVDTWNGIANRRCKFEKPDLFIRHVEPFSNERIYITHFPDVTHWRLLPTPPNEKSKSWTDKQDTLDKAKSASLKPNKDGKK